ncbi:MAG: class I lanthipeptide [Hyphomicrobiales bacterium]
MKKLSLKKQTIAQLDKIQTKEVFGGGTTMCPTDILITCPVQCLKLSLVDDCPTKFTLYKDECMPK